MKTGIACIVACGATFMAFQLAMTFFGPASEAESGRVQAAPQPPAAFPDDLLPALRRRPVQRAAGFRKDNDCHGCAVLTRAGKIHNWHLTQHSDWRADSVEQTEIVLVLGRQTQAVIEVVPYRDGPSITRYRHDLDAWVIEAKTGRLLASKHFESVARPCSPVERLQTTHLGDPVTPATVQAWVFEVTERMRSTPLQDLNPGEDTTQVQN